MAINTYNILGPELVDYQFFTYFGLSAPGITTGTSQFAYSKTSNQWYYLNDSDVFVFLGYDPTPYFDLGTTDDFSTVDDPNIELVRESFKKSSDDYLNYIAKTTYKNWLPTGNIGGFTGNTILFYEEWKEIPFDYNNNEYFEPKEIAIGFLEWKNKFDVVVDYFLDNLLNSGDLNIYYTPGLTTDTYDIFGDIEQKSWQTLLDTAEIPQFNYTTIGSRFQPSTFPQNFKNSTPPNGFSGNSERGYVVTDWKNRTFSAWLNVDNSVTSGISSGIEIPFPSSDIKNIYNITGLVNQGTLSSDWETEDYNIKIKMSGATNSYGSYTNFDYKLGSKSSNDYIGLKLHFSFMGSF